jgi:hypothetical protein
VNPHTYDKEEFLKLLISAFDWEDLSRLERLASEELTKQVRAKIASGEFEAPTLPEVVEARRGPTERISAIKIYRMRTGAGLFQSKVAIDACIKDWQRYPYR